MDRAALNVREVAGLLGVSDDTVRRRIADGTLPALRFGGRVLVPAAALAALVGPTVVKIGVSAAADGGDPHTD